MKQTLGGMRPRLLAIVATIAAFMALVAPTSADAPIKILNPIGGGYSDATETAFVQNVIDQATGDSVRIVVIPSAYAHTSLGYAKAHVDELQSICTALLGTGSSIRAGCDTEMVPLWTRDDAENTEYANMISNPETDGIFILGGDQDAAMEILANTPSEAAMATAYERGAVVSGTSAGDAVESHTMIADYANGGGPSTALQKDKVDIWWSDNSDSHRGLSFGSDTTILDQHFFQRGRFTRLLNVTAQSYAHFDGDGRLGVGVDYATSVKLTNDATLSDVAGRTSVAIIDFSNAEFSWVDSTQTLSATGIVTHIMPEGDFSYDVPSRTMTADGTALSAPKPGDLPSLQAQSTATLMLGGDVLTGGNVLADFVDQARQSSSHRIVVVAAGFFSSGDASSAGNAYSQALKKLGWSRSGDTVQVVNFEAHTEWSRVAPSLVAGAAGVIFVGGDQSQMSRPLGDATFTDLVSEALDNAPVVLTDRAMTPVMGDDYMANADPTVDNVQSVAIDAFHDDYAQFTEGLHIVNAALEPRLMTDQRWGRLYSLVRAHSDEIAYGIDAQTAIVFSGGTATVRGNRSVVALDGREATFANGKNDAYAALNVIMNLYASGQTLP